MKKFFNTVLLIYVFGTLIYLGYKYFSNGSLSKDKLVEKSLKEEELFSSKISSEDCYSYAFATFNENDNVFKTRIDKKCFNEGDFALVFYDSKPHSIVKFLEYVKDKDRDFAVFIEEKVLWEKKIEDSDFVTLVFNYNLENYMNHGEEKVTEDDIETVQGLADTTYYLQIDEDTAHNTKLEYEILKTKIDKYGNPDLFAVVNWYPKSLNRGERYTSIFNLYRGKRSSTRFNIMTIRKKRDEYYHLFQIIDLFGDGTKELIIRKVEDKVNYFIIYRFSVDFGYKKLDEYQF